MYVAFRFVLAQKNKKINTFRGNQQGRWSKFVVFALEQNFRK